MHPWVAMIHPSLRTALAAWLTSRAGFWLVLLALGRPPLPDAGTFASGAEGTPLWAALTGVLGLLGEQELLFGASRAAWALAVLGEVAVGVLLWGVYQFARRDAMPQLAERATWIAALSPLMLWTLPTGPWVFAAALVAAGAHLVFRGHLFAALACVLAAMGFRLEVLLLAPGLAMFGWASYRPGRDHALSPWALSFGPLAGLPLIVFSVFMMAGRGGVSLRALGGHVWRSGWHWQGVMAHAGELTWLAALLTMIVATAHAWRQLPRAALVMLVPALLWPIALAEPLMGTGLWLAALPITALLARAAEDPVVERPMLHVQALITATMLILGVQHARLQDAPAPIIDTPPTAAAHAPDTHATPPAQADDHPTLAAR